MTVTASSRSDPEREAFKKGLELCAPSLKAFAISLCGNESRADDLVQQTYLQALEALDSFKPGTNMSAWLFTILRNRYYSDYRKRKREAEWNPDYENEISFSTGNGEGAAAAYDLHVLLLYLTCVPPGLRDALVCIGYLGLSYEETAERLGCRVGTVKSRVNRAREMLAELMKTTKVVQADLTQLQTATKGVPKNHPYYPVAQAYEELFLECVSKGEVAVIEPTVAEKEWENLVASGALDDEDDLPHFLT